MTNYGWLVSNNKLDRFIFDIALNDITEGQNAELVKEKYGLNLDIPSDQKGRIAKQIAYWLLKEHKSNKYVPLQSVLDVLQNSLPATCLDYDTADKIFQEVYNLDGKEIDE